MSFSITKPSTRPEWASAIAVTLFGVMGGMQVFIAAGLLPSDIVWGGANEELTIGARIASLAACAILLGMAYVIHRRTQPLPSEKIKFASKFIAFYMILNTLGNAMGSTWVEQYVFGTMTLVLCICSFIVASSEPLDPPGANDKEEGAATSSTPLSATAV